MARYGRDFGGQGFRAGRGGPGDFQRQGGYGQDFRGGQARGAPQHPGSQYGGYGNDTGFADLGEGPARGFRGNPGGGRGDFSGEWSRQGFRGGPGRYGGDFRGGQNGGWSGRGGGVQRGGNAPRPQGNPRRPGDHYGSDYGGYGGNW